MANLWNGPALKNAEAAKKKAWTNFLNRFPKADKSRFVSQGGVDEKNNVTAEVFFKESEDSFQSVFGSDRKYWRAEMKEALGLGDSGGFPYQLAPLGSKVSLAIPAVPFDGKAPSLKKIFDDAIQIYVTPDQYFTTKFREIFQTQTHVWNRIKTLVRRARHEILAAAAQLRGFLRDTGVRSFS